MFNIYRKTIKKQGHFLIQPVNVFPTYDEQPGPSTDDYIRNPDLRASGALPCRGLFLKTTLERSGFLSPKPQNFKRVREKGLIDKPTVICYLNFSSQTNRVEPYSLFFALLHYSVDDIYMSDKSSFRSFTSFICRSSSVRTSLCPFVHSVFCSTNNA